MNQRPARLLALIAVLLCLALVAAFYTRRFLKRSGYLLPKAQVAQRKIYDGPPATTASTVEDWPRWRGPRGDQISREPFPDTLPTGGPKQLWAADVGIGYSSPVLANGRVYLFSLTTPTETLTAFDANSGKIVWTVQGGKGWVSSYPGTRATPAIDGDRIYTYGGAGELTCRNLADGAVRWRLDVLATAGTKPNNWGTASSPLVAGNAVYVQAGVGGPVAIAADKTTGSILWKSQATGTGGYAHPILIDVAGTPQLIVVAGDAILAMNPADGKTLWRYPWPTSFDVNASTPIYRDGKLFVTSEYQHGCIQLQVTPTSAAKIWENNHIEGKFQGAILDGDHLYANSAGTLVCVNWNDGSLKWRATDTKLRLGVGGSVIRSGDKLLTLSDRGKLSLLHATPDGHKLLAQADDVVDGTEVWSTPLFHAGRLYAKGAQELVCQDLAPTK